MILDTDALLNKKTNFFSLEKLTFFFFSFLSSHFFQQHKKKETEKENFKRWGKKASENSFNDFFVKLH